MQFFTSTAVAQLEWTAFSWYWFSIIFLRGSAQKSLSSLFDEPIDLYVIFNQAFLRLLPINSIKQQSLRIKRIVYWFSDTAAAAVIVGSWAMPKHLLKNLMQNTQ